MFRRFALLPHLLFVVITNAKLDLGPWEQIFHAEFNGNRRKRVTATFNREGEILSSPNNAHRVRQPNAHPAYAVPHLHPAISPLFRRFALLPHLIFVVAITNGKLDLGPSEQISHSESDGNHGKRVTATSKPGGRDSIEP